MIELKPGDKAPHFTGQNEDEETINLADYKGKGVILFFYPKDDTPGCTAEGCSLRDNYGALRDMGYEILGVSPDKPKKHRKFIDKYSFPFSLIADPDKEILQSYGVWGQKKFMGKSYTGVLRTTFVINDKGIIEHIIEKVKTKDHAGQIIDLLATAD